MIRENSDDLQNKITLRIARGCVIQVGRQSIRQAAMLLDEGHADKTAFCAMAKRVATDNGFSVCNDALQLFGG